ncbi:MAG: tetratricopeptide repeat protein [Candidatus Aminicenantes bacterium]|nr:tetratricopeptide repeat protein [Candidatus Aminicenantes bacterium]
MEKGNRSFPAGGIALVLILGLTASCASGPGAKKNVEKDPRHQYNLGLIYLNNLAADETALNKAIVHFRKALALDPKHFLALNALGLAHSMKGDLGQAAEAFQKCLEINPSFTEARNNLGSIYEAQGFLDRAEAEYKKALADENYVSRQLPLYNLARMAFRQDKTKEASDYLDRALRYDPRMAMGHNLKGMILEKLEDNEGALISYEKAARLVPDDMNLLFNAGRLCAKTGRPERARDILTTVLEKSDDPELRKKASEALASLKKP